MPTPTRPKIIAITGALILLAGLAITAGLLLSRSEGPQRTELASLDREGATALRSLRNGLRILPGDKPGQVVLEFDGIPAGTPRPPLDSENLWHAAATLSNPIRKGDLISIRYRLEAKFPHPVVISVGSGPETANREAHRIETTGNQPTGSILFISKHNYAPGQANVYIGLGLGSAAPCRIGFELLDLVVTAPDNYAETSLLYGNSQSGPMITTNQDKRKHWLEVRNKSRSSRKVPLTVSLADGFPDGNQVEITVSPSTSTTFPLFTIARGLGKIENASRKKKRECAIMIRGLIKNYAMSPGFEWSATMGAYELKTITSIYDYAKGRGVETALLIPEGTPPKIPPEILSRVTQVITDPRTMDSGALKSMLAKSPITLLIPESFVISSATHETEYLRGKGREFNALASEWQKRLGVKVGVILTPETRNSLLDIGMMSELFTAMALDCPYVIRADNIPATDADNATTYLHSLVYGAYGDLTSRGLAFVWEVGEDSHPFISELGKVRGLGSTLYVYYQFSALSESKARATGPIEMEAVSGRARVTARIGDNYLGATKATILPGATVVIPTNLGPPASWPRIPNQSASTGRDVPR